MANVVGGLAVLLGLDATEYTRGLTKAEYQAKQFARNTRSAILEVAKVIGTIEIGRQVYEATKAIIAEAAALNDLAAATGSTVESLSRLNNQVKISGGDINSMNDAVLKLAAGMSGADSKGSKVNETLKLLGITAKDPVQALQEVALKLATYADGVNKVGLAQALFGKSGREFLKTLQDIAESQQVGATVTAKQAAEAEALEKSWRSLAVQSTQFQNAILSNVVPVLLEVITNFNLARQAGEDFFGAMLRAGTNMATLPDQIARAGAEVEKFKAAVAAGPKGQGNIPGFLTITDADVRQSEAKYKALLAIRNNAILQVQGDNSDQISRRFQRLAQAPALPGRAGAGGRTKALKEATDEGLRYLQSLEKQLRATMELSHEEEARFAIFDALRKGQAGFTDQVQANIIDLARQLDITEDLKKAEQERKKSQEQIQQATNNAIKSAMQEAEATKQGNEQLQEQITFLRGGEEAVNRMTDAKLQSTIAEKEATLAVLQHLDADALLIAQTAEQIKQLKERQGLLFDKRAAEIAAEEAKLAKQYADDLGNALAQGAENAILHFNNLRDVLKGVEQDLLRIITRKLVTQPLGNFFSDLIGTGIGGLFGGGSTYGMNVRASGGPVAANQPYVVGERGPELFMPKTAGTIIPNSQTGRGNFVFNINVPAGATRSTIEQTQLKFGMALQSVMDRNG